VAEGRGGAGRWAVPGMVVAVAAWLWPVGVGGKMPVGGDVTQFFLGPMAVLARALRAGRSPVWNDLWGYGFPGVGESQMGVYYPPHVVLYGLLGPGAAYTASLVAHTVWGSLGAYFAARRFGGSAAGSALGGYAWSACGFFQIHLTHQWGYTTGCWMPWAWGLAWSVLNGKGRPRDPFLLALVLTAQLLPGHFQLAFCTQVGVLVLAGARAAGSWREGPAGLAGVARTLAAVAGAFALGAMQLWPTYRLARLAAPRRDLEYLSGFAASPLHLVTFVAPGLFERSPLWRPLVWDPFHTSPEEYLGYVGLIPLFLAFGAIRTGMRRSPEVRALAAVGLVTLLLGLGPYVPGFRALIVLPGFSFFRAPGRWLLATSLALSCLAAIGFDACRTWKRPGRALLAFSAAAAVLTGCVVAAVEGGLWSVGTGGTAPVAAVYARAFASLPWHEPDAFARLSQAARRPNLDPRVAETWARQGVDLRGAPRPVFVEQRFAVYRQELAGSAALWLALAGLAPLAGRRGFAAALVGLTLLDLGWLNRERRVDFGPVAPLVGQSPVLARLNGLPPGTRTVDGLRNLPMLAGAAPVSAYRTLDLPALDSLTALAGRVPESDDGLPSVLRAFALTGAGVRVFDPIEWQELDRLGISWPGRLDDVRDPALAGWRFGADRVRQQGPRASTFRLVTTPGTPALGWLVPLTGGRSAAILGEWTGSPWDVLRALDDARPLDVRRPGPTRREVAFRTDAAALVVLSELADPEWRATLTGPPGTRAVAVERAFGRPNQGAWQAVKVPGPGDWTLRLNYRGRDVVHGLIVSGGAAAVLAALFVGYGRGPARGEGEGIRP